LAVKSIGCDAWGVSLHGVILGGVRACYTCGHGIESC
jgi:hypothetical protein